MNNLYKYNEIVSTKILAHENIIHLNLRQKNTPSSSFFEEALNTIRRIREETNYNFESFTKRYIDEHFIGAAVNNDMGYITYVVENHSDKITAETYSKAFELAVVIYWDWNKWQESLNKECAKFLLENDKGWITPDTVISVFNYLSKQYYYSDLTELLVDKYKEILSDEVLNNAFLESLNNYNSTFAKLLAQRDLIDLSDLKGIQKVFILALRSLNKDFAKYLVEKYKDKLTQEALNKAFEQAISYESILYDSSFCKLLIEEGLIDLSDQNYLLHVFEMAASSYDEKLITLLAEKYSNIFTQEYIINIFENLPLMSGNNFGISLLEDVINNGKIEPNNKEFIIKLAHISTNITNPKGIKLLIENNLFIKPDHLKLFGFSNYVGEWSANVISYLNKDNNIRTIRLEREDTENEALLSIFDGFINPGAGDTFPREGEFDITYLEEGEHRDHEFAYQNVISYVKEHSLPYLGLCNGTQHLILNSKGFISHVPDTHFETYPHLLKTIPGSIVHYLSMNEYEQKATISQGYFPEIEFSISTAHGFAGVADKIGSLELGGTTKEGVIEAVANNFYQVGFQFHPENMYNSSEDEAMGGRNANLLNNVFKFFLIDRKTTDLNKMHEYMYFELKDAYEHAKCPSLEDTCPVLEPFARDLFAEAMGYAKIELI